MGLRFRKITIATAGFVLLAAAALAQSTPPSPPPEGGTELGNWGAVPFVAQETLVLRPDDRAALRRLEDKHVKEMRDLEDRFESEIRALRQKHANERDALGRSFKR